MALIGKGERENGEKGARKEFFKITLKKGVFILKLCIHSFIVDFDSPFPSHFPLSHPTSLSLLLVLLYLTNITRVLVGLYAGYLMITILPNKYLSAHLNFSKKLE